MTENKREVDKDMREMVDRVKRGEPLYGTTELTDYMQGVAARNSRYTGVFLHVMPMFNFVNHNQVCPIRCALRGNVLTIVAARCRYSEVLPAGRAGIGGGVAGEGCDMEERVKRLRQGMVVSNHLGRLYHSTRVDAWEIQT